MLGRLIATCINDYNVWEKLGTIKYDPKALFFYMAFETRGYMSISIDQLKSTYIIKNF